MSDPLLLAIDALAVYRLSRLIVADSIFDVPRDWLLARWPGDETFFYDPDVYSDDNDFGELKVSAVRVVRIDTTWVAATPRWFGKWVSCIWCVSPYVAAAVVMARQWWDWWQYPAMVAAMSAVAGIIHTRTNQ